MAVEVYMDEIETDAIGGFDRVQPGHYHAKVTYIDEEGGKKGELIAEFEILRGTTANQEGKVHREYFGRDAGKMARKKLLALAIAGGLTTKAALDRHKADGTSPSLDYTQIVGRQVCLDLEQNEYNGKTSTRLAWDQVYHPADKRASHVPVLLKMLTDAGITLPPGRNPDGAVPAKTGSGGGGSNTTTAAPAATAKQAANVDELLAGV